MEKKFKIYRASTCRIFPKNAYFGEAFPIKLIMVFGLDPNDSVGFLKKHGFLN